MIVNVASRSVINDIIIIFYEKIDPLINLLKTSKLDIFDDKYENIK